MILIQESTAISNRGTLEENVSRRETTVKLHFWLVLDWIKSCVNIDYHRDTSIVSDSTFYLKLHLLCAAGLSRLVEFSTKVIKLWIIFLRLKNYKQIWFQHEVQYSIFLSSHCNKLLIVVKTTTRKIIFKWNFWLRNKIIRT